MSVNKKCVQFMYENLILLFALILVLGCDPASKEAKILLIKEYPALYEAVFARNPEAILEFTNHPHERVRQQAWQALINTPVSDIDNVIEAANKANTKEAWASLWLKEFSEDHIARLNGLFKNSDVTNTGLVSILGEKGDATSFEVLMNAAIPPNEEMEFEMAYAIGKLAGNVEISETQQIQVIERALATQSSGISQGYLYGWYRNRNNEEKPKLTDNAEAKLLELWADFYPDGRGADRYIAALLFKNHAARVFYHFVETDYAELDIQLAIELSRLIAQTEEVDPYAAVALNAFLNHKNPNVVLTALQAIVRKEEILKRINDSMLNATALNEVIEDRVRLSGLNTAVNPEDYVDDMIGVGKENPYLQGLRYSVFKKVWDEKQVFDELISEINSSSGLKYSYLLTELNTLWANAEERLKTPENTEQAREILLVALNNGERAFLLQALSSDEDILREKEYDDLISIIDEKESIEDAGYISSITGILKNRFEERAKDYITDLYDRAAFDLRQNLIAQEWSVIKDSLVATVFRVPDWERLAWLGPNPIWVLETKKGNIEITLDVLSAPATISGMDSLITHGNYDGVAFHRVVPNFVIQGGDVQTGRGFGGPDYVVPTEASANHYQRGKAGIASSGPDTEGSQYFFMHVWAPHLNGRYTIYGEVTKGMSVVDRITQGDIVEKTYWK